jgi:transposase
VYPGNVSDSTHFKTALKKLEERIKELGLSLSKITLAFDKGALSKDAFKVIDEGGFEFIASVRPSTQKDILGTPPEEFSRIIA